MPIIGQDTLFNMGNKEKLRSHNDHVYTPAPAKINMNVKVAIRQ